jgi:RNA polymerase sigma-70 factor (ECF subfamily)
MTLQQEKLRIKKDEGSLMEGADDELIQKVIRDRAAFAELYKRNVEKVYRYFIFKVGNQQDAQELTSQTFLAALENIASYRREGSFSGWLFGIASRKAARFFHQKKYNPIELTEDVAAHLPPLDHAVEQGLELSRVMSALNHLSNARAEAIRLYFFSSLSVVEVAEVMGKSQPSIRMLLHRGIRDLKQRLEQGGVK